MAGEANIEAAKRGYAAFSAGDAEVVTFQTAEDTALPERVLVPVSGSGGRGGCLRP